MSDATILLGAVAHDPKVLPYWEAMREHLKANGVGIDFALYSSYERQVEALLGGHIDLAWSGPLAHVRIKRRAEGRLVLIAQRDVDREFTTKILVRRDAGIGALSELHGKTLAIGSKDSAQARILPLFFLKRAGVDLAKMTLLPFDLDAGKHGDPPQSELDVLAAVQDGRAHAGVVGGLVFATELAAGRVDPHRVETLWTTPSYDHHVLEALPSFPEAKALALQRVLLDLRWNNPKHRRLLEIEGARQWIAAREDGHMHLEAALDDQRGW